MCVQRFAGGGRTAVCGRVKVAQICGGETERRTILYCCKMYRSINVGRTLLTGYCRTTEPNLICLPVWHVQSRGLVSRLQRKATYTVQGNGNGTEIQSGEISHINVQQHGVANTAVCPLSSNIETRQSSANWSHCVRLFLLALDFLCVRVCCVHVALHFMLRWWKEKWGYYRLYTPAVRKGDTNTILVEERQQDIMY